MKWKIVYTPEAEYDLDEIYNYIAYNLKAPKAAANTANRIMSDIEKLDNMPMKFKVYDFEPWRAQQLRCFSVDNYVVFYLLSEEAQTVYISRIIYGRRDLNEQLENSDGL